MHSITTIIVNVKAMQAVRKENQLSRLLIKYGFSYQQQILLRSGEYYSRTKENRNGVVTNVIVSENQILAIKRFGDNAYEAIDVLSTDDRKRFTLPNYKILHSATVNAISLLDGDGAPPGAGALPAGDGRSKDHISVDMRSK
ncbi:hypothetical protein RIR_jg11504.t1 [Rhizophagus irregularis DAOM 181602=DAOM 197198]|nr:hypothetical protein RIR_jg11504.t1 [Rhizophagus irregularis DAOM 181602=DAOM 197198]